jgi:DNA-binding Lrp family transcriptional regulator
MAREKKATDEQIIAALLANGTLRAVAAAVGISERTLYDRMNEGDFQALYKAAKADLIRAAVFNINNQLQAAIDTVVEVMQNPENNAAVRLQAAQTILNNAGKFAQRLQTDETSVITQIDSNRFSIW